mmetsp:Transcript_8321/g.14692  ORF Transcript_8321/g.14692 Transcript_8321/m.14692 type:complete len:275 (+) Transcript_8321:1213-2037(+)
MALLPRSALYWTPRHMLKKTSQSRQAKSTVLSRSVWYDASLQITTATLNRNTTRLKQLTSGQGRPLKSTKKDKRPHIYSFEELAEARTNDELWNAAQVMAREEGKMHGWLRMYWAKQLLIWTETPEEALDYGLRLNDIYNLDGGDPNSVVGVGWSIMGIHDQGWKEREIFGKIRCMTYKSSRTKFDVDKLARAYPGPGASSGKGNDSSSGEKKKKDNENKKKVTSKKEKKEDKPETNKQNSKRKSSSKDENGDDSKSKSSKSTGRTKKKAKKAE